MPDLRRTRRAAVPGGPAAVAGATPVGAASPARRRLDRATLLVMVTGLVVTAALSAGAEVSFVRNQSRLTSLQANLTGSLLGTAPLDFERRLGQVADAASSSSDPTATFRRLISPSMKPGGPFASATLVKLDAGKPTVLAHLGTAPINSLTGPAATAAYVRAASSGALVTTRAVGHGVQKLGFLMSSAGPEGTFVVSGAQAVPVGDVLSIAPSSPDAGLDIAIYFGRTADAGDLVASTDGHPITGAVSTVVVPFGTSNLLLVAAPRSALAGTLLETLPWTIAAAGVVLTAVIASLVERLVRRRERAEDLAAEVDDLFHAQRDISLTLQRALVPSEHPQVAGVEVASRYVPGAAGSAVGGDWYSLIPHGDRDLYFVVGDVSGRGVEAAALMAQLRFTIRTLAVLGRSPAEILGFAARDLDPETTDHFATVLVGLIEDRRRLTIASAGHFPPLLAHGDVATFLRPKVGLPLGVGAGEYEETEVALPVEGLLVAFTDGLIERRSEVIDEGLDRLRAVVSSHAGAGVDLLATAIMSELAPSAPSDDAALLAIGWSETVVEPDRPPSAPIVGDTRPTVPAVPS